MTTASSSHQYGIIDGRVVEYVTLICTATDHGHDGHLVYTGPGPCPAVAS